MGLEMGGGFGEEAPGIGSLAGAEIMDAVGGAQYHQRQRVALPTPIEAPVPARQDRLCLPKLRIVRHIERGNLAHEITGIAAADIAGIVFDRFQPRLVDLARRFEEFDRAQAAVGFVEFDAKTRIDARRIDLVARPRSGERGVVGIHDVARRRIDQLRGAVERQRAGP